MPLSRRELNRLLAFGFGATLIAACTNNRHARPPRPTNEADVPSIAHTATLVAESYTATNVRATRVATHSPTQLQSTHTTSPIPPTASTVSTIHPTTPLVPTATDIALTNPTAIAPTTQVQALQALGFEAFADLVTIHRDDTYLYIESNGLPRHPMMIGIRSWQQQLPLAQQYRGTNAWKVPLHPHPAVNPISAQQALYRGAIAIAVNGVPIFNALNNRGDDAYLAGELDNWGGHSGRADDYHYHIAPLHLQAFIGADQPIAYALDGYAIYGLLEPNGSEPVGLDAFNGHIGPDGVYHYHASKTYPYINGGMYGEVSVQDDQIEPQPHLVPFRQPQRPLPGAVVTDFIQHNATHSTLVYTLNGQTYSIDYEQTERALNLQFHDTNGNRSESYEIRPSSTNSNNTRSTPQPTASAPQPATAQGFVLSSPAVGSDMTLPATYTCDGERISPPLTWTNVPAGTQSLALIMHHEAGPGDVHWYWIVYNIPPTTTAIASNDQGIGTYGNNSVNPLLAYAPPCSKGPGRKEYTISLYALSAAPQLNANDVVNRDVLLAAISDRTIAVATLTLNYTR